MEQRRGQAESVVNLWADDAYCYAGQGLTHQETLTLFRAGLWGSDASRRAMLELAKRWHFFDPLLKDEAALWKRRCFMEMLILSGMWHPDGLDTMFLAQTQPVGKGWAQRLLQTLTAVWPRKKDNG